MSNIGLRAALAATLAAGPAALMAQQQQPEVTLKVYPAAIRLDHAGDEQPLLVIAEDHNGMHRDVTAEVTWEITGAGAAPAVEVAGAQPGAGSRASVRHHPEAQPSDLWITAHWNTQSARAAVHVVAAPAHAEVSFAHDVIPVLTRQGCNAGSCHGAATGKNGFRLSLFGYDTALDHRTLTRELRGRRADPSAPDLSLLLTKPTGHVTHKGGVRFDNDSEAHSILRRWIEEGVRDDSAEASAVTRLEILPADLVLPRQGTPSVHLQVRAHYQDGSDRDVTRWAILSSSNENCATIAADGTVTAAAPSSPTAPGSETTIMARYGPCTQAVPVLVVPGDRPLRWPEAVATEGVVDQRIHKKLRRMRVAPAPRCSDEVFVRRAYVDITNRLPTVAQTKAFLAAPDRSRLIDTLLETPAFADLWAMIWAETLQMRRQVQGAKGVHLFRSFLREGFAAARPFDAMVREMLTATGDTHQNPAANYYAGNAAPILLAERAAQGFLGIRIQCAQCHDHPFDNWTMDDYYGFAAFFAQIGRKVGEDRYQYTVWNRRYGDIRHLRTKATTLPMVLGGQPEGVPYNTDRREVVAQWLTAADNPWFSKNVANRVWARLMGRGLVDPADDVRVSNPPSHPELLHDLGQHFVDAGFDLRAVVRVICNSHTYQAGPPAGDDLPADPALYAHNHVRRLSAETLLDGIAQVTGIPNTFAGLPVGASATSIEGERTDSRFLSVFGRPERQSQCTCERVGSPTLGQALHLLNGDTIAAKLSQKNNRLRQALANRQPPAELLRELFLIAYSRPPTADEQERLLALVQAAGDDPLPAWEDITWALLNSKEFTFHY